MVSSWQKYGKITISVLDPIKDEIIAVIGYGIQGDAQANNMRDSGLNVIVGLKEGSNTWKKAESDGHKVFSVRDAVKQADIIHILIPDMIQGQVYKDEIESNLSAGNALSFSHAAANLLEMDRGTYQCRPNHGCTKGAWLQSQRDLS